jgi:uncharacterized DUF497 family protein
MDPIDFHRITRCRRFQWDEANTDKNWRKHRVASSECESIFFNKPLLVDADIGHSVREQRFYAFGKTNEGRFLFVAFTLRGDAIRVISARDMSRRERKAFHNAQEKDTD